MAFSKIFFSLTLLVVMGLLLLVTEGKQSGSKYNQVAATSPKSSSEFVNYITSNETLLFSQRFGKRPRVSSRFHYPALPDVYWKTHKRPVVPLFDESLYDEL